MRKVLEECPSCGGPLAITALKCTRCEVGVSGRFKPCDFCRLSEEQSTFLRLFVQRRGNLSEMEKALGISYPTVRNKLEEIIKLLDAQPAPEAAPVSGRDAILRQVATGALSAEEALTRLRSLSEEEK
jgi:hypothetical protein